MPVPADIVWRLAGRGDLPSLTESLAAAFQGYPLTRWVVRQDARAEQRRALYFRTFLEHGLAHGEILCDDALRGAAIWYPPGAGQRGIGTFARLLPRLARISGPRALPSRVRALRQLAARHPAEPHSYLEVLGVHPDAQRCGIGGALLEAGLARADAQGVAAHLLTSNPASLPFYEARGFAVTESFAVAGGPAMRALWRAPS